MSGVDLEFYHATDCTPCVDLNRAISEQVLALQHSELARKSHFFAGRFENIYVAAEHIPHLQVILDSALGHAAQLLGTDRQFLQLGFWFNIMQAGDITLPHSHDDDDELLSGTYYLQAPPGSGMLVLQLPSGTKTIIAEAGRLVLFHPAVIHEVTRHESETPRISIGFNIGRSRADV